MIRTAALCLLGLVASAYGQTKLVTVDGTLMVRKQVSVNVAELQAEVDEAIATLNALSASSDVFDGAEEYIAGKVAANTNATIEVATKMAQIEAELKYNSEWVSMVGDAVEEMEERMDSEDQAIKSKIASASATIGSEGQKVSALATSELGRSKTSILKSVRDSITAATAVLNAAGSSLRDTRRHLFSGGDKGDGGRGGWRDFVVNMVEVNTAAPYFQLRTSTRFRALRTGVYHILWWAIQRGGRCHAHNRIRYDKGAWIHEHDHNWLTDGAWEGNTLNLHWKFNKNKDFWTTHYNSCGVRWHSRPGNINDANAYNRIFVEYVGQVQKDNGDEIRWNGPQ